MPSSDLAHPGPISLDSAFLAGAVFAGDDVVEIWVKTRNGSEARRVFALGEPEEFDPEADLTPKQQAILQAVNEMKIGDRETYEQIAQRAGYSNTDDLRKFMRKLQVAERVRITKAGVLRLC